MFDLSHMIPGETYTIPCNCGVFPLGEWKKLICDEDFEFVGIEELEEGDKFKFLGYDEKWRSARILVKEEEFILVEQVVQGSYQIGPDVAFMGALPQC